MIIKDLQADVILGLPFFTMQEVKLDFKLNIMLIFDQTIPSRVHNPNFDTDYRILQRNLKNLEVITQNLNDQIICR